MSDLVLLCAKTEMEDGPDKISIFLVEGDRPGFKRGKNLDKVGRDAQDTSELFFEDVEVDEKNRVGEDAVEAVAGQLERQHVLMPDLAARRRPRHRHEGDRGVEAHRRVAARDEGGEVAARPAAEIEDALLRRAG